MDFNSNDEYLKAFPPNFGPKIERPDKEVLRDLDSYGLPSKDPQEEVVEEPVSVCLDDEMECAAVEEPIEVEAKEPIQFDTKEPIQPDVKEPIQPDAKEPIQPDVQEPIQSDANEPIEVNLDDVLLEEQEEILILGENLAPEIDEPMPEMADIALLRDEEMVIDDGDGGALETMLTLEAINVLDTESPLGDVEAEGPHSEVEAVEEKIVDAEAIRKAEIKEPDTSSKAFTTDHSEAEKLFTEERVTEEAMEDEVFEEPDEVLNEPEEVSNEPDEAFNEPDEAFEEPNLKEFVRSTRVFTERPATDVDTVEGNAIDTVERNAVIMVEGNAMDTDALNSKPAIEIQVIESTLITAETPDQIKFVESALKTLEEASENTDAIGQIEIKEPVTLEVIEKTTLRTIPQTESKEKTEPDVGAEDPTMALEIIEKTTVKAKAISQDEEEPRFTVKFSESTSTSITGFNEELGTLASLGSSEADVDRIVDSIMNDIAGIEADIKDGEDAGLEASIESNTQLQKVPPIYEKPVGIECEDLSCQDHVGPSGGHA